MRITVERLRVGLVLGASLLVVVLAGFYGYARYRLHRALVDLPARMGATITKEFNGYTYSQSDHGKTVFTIHASKAVQHTDGTLTLHDVSMILYGKKGDRADRISGDQFEYDTKEEIIRAAGIVHLDLAAPAAEGTQTTEAAKHLDPTTAEAAGASRVIHVTTSGLVYLKKVGIAATKNEIEFAFGGFSGHAVGAEYNSNSGDLVLQSALTLSGLDKGRPVALTASHGTLDHAQNTAELSDARYNSAGEIARADAARLHLRVDGSLQRIEGERHVSLEEAADGKVTADRVDAALDAKSKPETAVFTGNVRFAEDEPLRQAHGDSERADVKFDEQGHIDHALLQGKVRTLEVVRRPGDTVPLSQRSLEANTLELWLAGGSAGSKPLLRDVKASGSACLSSAGPDPKAGGTTSTKLGGDTLVAHMLARNGFAELSTMHATGHTLLQQTTLRPAVQSAIDQRSTGESLDAVFRPNGKSKGSVELASVVQQGRVVIDRSIPPKITSTANAPNHPEVQHATAAEAAFNADTDKLTLTGDVRMWDAETQIAATRVVMDQDAGNAAADGAVKVTYQQQAVATTEAGSDSQAKAEPVHVLAARADLNHDAGRATFYGRVGGGVESRARMWQAGTSRQAGSQVEAPVLVFEQEEKRLTARSDTVGETGTVHAVLASASAMTARVGDEASPTLPNKRPSHSTAASGKDAAALTMKATAKGSAGKGEASPGVARITSSLLVYSDLKRQAEFTGGVRVLDQGGEMQARSATVYLTPSPAHYELDTGGRGRGAGSGNLAEAPSANGPQSSLSGLFGGNVERIVATEHIEIMQPGRKATGERLVYTAGDQMFVLTGTANAPPKVIDQVQGTTTGAMLRFQTGDDDVVVSGNDGEAPPQRVRTETLVKSVTSLPPGPGKLGNKAQAGTKVQGTKVKQN